MRQSLKFISDIYFLTLLINVAGHSRETENKQENYMENSRNLFAKSETAANRRRRQWVFPLPSPRKMRKTTVIKELIRFQQFGRHVFALN